MENKLSETGILSALLHLIVAAIYTGTVWVNITDPLFVNAGGNEICLVAM